MEMTMQKIIDLLGEIIDMPAPNKGDLMLLREKITQNIESKIQDTSKQEKKVILVDFDGVINSYKSGFDLYNIPDEPLPGAFRTLRYWCKTYDVRIFSARCNSTEGIRVMKEWFKRYGGEDLLKDITFEPGKPSCHAIIDDRAIQFDGSFIEADGELLDFEPWYYSKPDWNRK